MGFPTLQYGFFKGIGKKCIHFKANSAFVALILLVFNSLLLRNSSNKDCFVLC